MEAFHAHPRRRLTPRSTRTRGERRAVPKHRGRAPVGVNVMCDHYDTTKAEIQDTHDS